MITGSGISLNVDSVSTLRSATNEWYGRAAVKVKNGVVICCYRHGSHHAVNDGELHIKFSSDYGATWTAEDTFTDSSAVSGFPMNPSTLNAGEDAGEPWLYLAPNGDLVLHMWRVDYNVSGNGTYQSRSTDGGKTWSTSAQVDFTGIANDSQVFATDDDFVYNSVIYAGARIHDADQNPSESILIKSSDNGTTWEKVSTICANNEGAGGTGAWEVGLEYLGNNTIIAELRMQDLTRAYQRVSTDMGATWGALTEMTSQIGIAGRQRVYTRTHLKGESNWWTDRYLIMTGFIHTTAGSSQGRINCIWFSTDAGTTWSNPKRIDVSYEDGGYGDIFYNANTGKYVVISYRGTQAEASLIQYNLTFHGVD
ncbi:MAG TPA: sialidase family protein [Patescibacteria group bacterium]|nr:sialidase family protein [Patescibacteria group bacterium]